MSQLSQEQTPEVITLSADSSSVTEIESLCMNCYKQGMTRLLLTNIPYFRDVLISHFRCPHCSFTNTHIEQTTPMQDHGIKYTLTVKNLKDLSRQIVKSDHCSINFPSIGFEIPETAQASSLNTLEGFITNSIVAMEYILQQLDPTGDDFQRIFSIVKELNAMKNAEYEYIVEVDDPTGNSFVQNLCVPKSDPQIICSSYIRSFEQNKQIGLIAENQEEITPATELDERTSRQLVPDHKNAISTRIGLPEGIDESVIPSTSEDVVELDEPCQFCQHVSKVRMMITHIPFFKEVTIMAFACENCGYRSNEVKCGGAVSEKAKRFTFIPQIVDDLSRSFLKSDTAVIHIPELGIELEPGTLGSKFTTIEGFLNDLINNFENLPFLRGDSAETTDIERVNELVTDLKDMKLLKKTFTLIVDDPMANSYIQNPYVPESDPCCTIEEYDRTPEQNEELGLNDIMTD